MIYIFRFEIADQRRSDPVAWPGHAKTSIVARRMVTAINESNKSYDLYADDRLCWHCNVFFADLWIPIWFCLRSACAVNNEGLQNKQTPESVWRMHYCCERAINSGETCRKHKRTLLLSLCGYRIEYLVYMCNPCVFILIWKPMRLLKGMIEFYLKIECCMYTYVCFECGVWISKKSKWIRNDEWMFSSDPVIGR